MASILQDLAAEGLIPQLSATQATPFTFRVLSGPMASQQLQTGQPAGTIVLERHSLPRRPISYTSRQRVKTTWYAGNGSATQQLMGQTLEPTELTGRWSDKFLGDGVAAGLAVVFQNILKSGSPVEVQWGGGVYAQTTVGVPYVRQGVISELEIMPERPQDIEWKMTLEWYSEGQVSAPVLTVGVQSPQSALAGLQQILDQANFAIDSFRQSPLGQIIEFDGNFEVSLDALRDSRTEFADILDAAEKAAGSIGDVSRSILERGVNISVTVNADLAAAEDAFLDLNLLKTETRDSPADTLAFLAAQLRILQDTSAQRQTVVETGTSLSGQLYPEVLAEVRPPTGTDLRDLAMQYYGDPDLWTVIAQYNGIDGSAIPALPSGPSDNPFAARAIRIPNRQAGPLGDIVNGC